MDPGTASAQIRAQIAASCCTGTSGRSDEPLGHGLQDAIIRARSMKHLTIGQGWCNIHHGHVAAKQESNSWSPPCRTFTGTAFGRRPNTLDALEESLSEERYDANAPVLGLIN